MQVIFFDSPFPNLPEFDDQDTNAPQECRDGFTSLVITCVVALPPGASHEYNVPLLFAPATGQAYQMTATVSLTDIFPTDPNPSNNTRTKVVPVKPFTR